MTHRLLKGQSIGPLSKTGRRPSRVVLDSLPGGRATSGAVQLDRPKTSRPSLCVLLSYCARPTRTGRRGRLQERRWAERAAACEAGDAAGCMPARLLTTEDRRCRSSAAERRLGSYSKPRPR